MQYRVRAWTQVVWAGAINASVSKVGLDSVSVISTSFSSSVSASNESCVCVCDE